MINLGTLEKNCFWSFKEDLSTLYGRVPKIFPWRANLLQSLAPTLINLTDTLAIESPLASTFFCLLARLIYYIYLYIYISEVSSDFNLFRNFDGQGRKNSVVIYYYP